MTAFRLLPAAARARGLAAIGIELEVPSALELETPDTGDTVVRCREPALGELDVAVFTAALVIDRDGILEQKVQTAIERAADDGTARVALAMPVSLPGASGYRGAAELVRPMGTPRPPLPHIYVFAIAPLDLGVDGGVLVTVRCAAQQWPAADAILGSLRLLGRRGVIAKDPNLAPLALPVVGRS